MPTITLIQADGSQRVLENLPNDGTLMQAALSHDVPGIIGECGGFCQCASCHVYVDEAWVDALPAPDEMEEAMLDCTYSPRQSNSRLCCQIALSEQLEGLVVRIPEKQM
ncbi:2Fe-2S iron-sulfur cluster-binding protein [Pseudomonas sp. NBRC 100443]|uniref:2Fe-2S iron-sulfur cluster-binding protein n=1 Tax=Pseudomonas sp. NBRC 100443 TaxID=1113665 RepID=UPI0024A11927|nr:2Fe-2S iron-sulfur cluster-binding protein [Pseudomonas sp. NBRC 100443]GLU37368.1 ferredoxin [Pseudomonas sp. NBRC 100443]